MLEKFFALSSDGPLLMGEVTGTGSYFTGTGSLVISLASVNVQPGDLVVSMMIAESGEDQGPPSGYTTICDLEANDSRDSRLVVAYKVMSDPVDSSVTLPVVTGGNTTGTAGIVQVWRNAAYGSATTATGLDSLLPNPPALTAPLGAKVVIVGGSGHGEGALTYSSSDAELTTASYSGSSDAALAAGYVQANGSSFDPATFTASVSDTVFAGWCACTFSLTEA